MAYRILSLDGGGSWALIEVKALIQLHGEEATGHQVLAKYDLIAANSGGSIVLAGLIEDKPLGEILTLFLDEDKRRSIFSLTDNLVDKLLQPLSLGAKYSAPAKLQALQNLLPKTANTPLTAAIHGIAGPGGKQVHMLIIGFNYDRNAATFFRSAEIDNAWGSGSSSDLSVASVVHASTNAPVLYFDGPAILPGSADRYWDGGLTGHNNPTLAACIEAITLGNQAQDLRVLSIGTATVRLPLADAGAPASPYLLTRPDPSQVGDLKKVTGTVLDDPPDFATFAAHVLTGGKDSLPAGLDSRIVRLNPLISPMKQRDGSWAAPAGWSDAQFVKIRDLGFDAVEDDEVSYVVSWCGFWLAGEVYNQPIRMDSQTLDVEIGQKTFQEAVLAWNRLLNI